ncbi:MAG TPA: hypothetical protein PK095_20595 [Myxococcota bacterium]|nr:hypothetical protein [Myxococcota bacterium]
MKRIMPWVVMPLLASFPLVACDSDDGEKDTTSDTTDTSQPGDTTDTTQPGVSALTGVNTNVTVTPPTPNASCDAAGVDNRTHGAKYPWGGAQIGNTSYTCNSCPGGIDHFQGSWRAHGFVENDGDDWDIDLSKGANANSDDAELLLIDGNTFYTRFYDSQSDTLEETRGWYFCSQKPENANEHIFWVKEEETSTGSVNRSNVILSLGASTDFKLIEWFDTITSTTSVKIGYCRLGAVRNGVTCNNPFE